MANYIEYGDKIAFHPGYYIKEMVDDSGLTQEDFAKRLDTTPKNLSELINGKQSLSLDIAVKLSRMMGTSVNYWLNLQSSYDAMKAEFESEEELERERKVFKLLQYQYFRDNFGLPDLPRMIDEQIKTLREFLGISSLCLLEEKDLAVNFRSSASGMTGSNIVKANAMVQIATNKALTMQKEECLPRFNKDRLQKTIQYALTLTSDHQSFYTKLKQKFANAGIIFVVLPNIGGSNVNGATKKIGKNVMLMVNDRGQYADTFWFTLFHEIGHIIHGDYGVSLKDETGEQERAADQFAQECLIPSNEYKEFVASGRFDRESIICFSNKINRDPGLIVGRLEKEGIVPYGRGSLDALRCKYSVRTKKRVG